MTSVVLYDSVIDWQTHNRHCDAPERNDKGFPYSPKLQNWSPNIRWLSAISRILVGVRGLTLLQKCSWCILQPQHTHTHTHMYIYIYIYIMILVVYRWAHLTYQMQAPPFPKIREIYHKNLPQDIFFHFFLRSSPCPLFTYWSSREAGKNVSYYLQRFTHLWHKTGRMEHPVRLELTSNGLLV